MADQLLTIAEAAARIGRSRRWLLRYIHAEERRTGYRILIRVGNGDRRPTYKVNLGQLRAVCPSLFDVRDPLSKALAQRAIVGAGMEHKIDEVLEQIAEVDSKVNALAIATRSLLRQRRER
jgi:hypothetical protein